MHFFYKNPFFVFINFLVKKNNYFNIIHCYKKYFEYKSSNLQALQENFEIHCSI